MKIIKIVFIRWKSSSFCASFMPTTRVDRICLFTYLVLNACWFLSNLIYKLVRDRDKFCSELG